MSDVSEIREPSKTIFSSFSCFHLYTVGNCDVLYDFVEQWPEEENQD